MKLIKLFQRLDYEVVQGNDEIEITELTNDSRTVCKDSVFVCISGAVVDGHEFVKEVVKRGSSCDCRKRGGSTGTCDGDSSERHQICISACLSSVFWISSRTVESNRDYRNKGKSNDDIYGEIYFGRCRT